MDIVKAEELAKEISHLVTENQLMKLVLQRINKIVAQQVGHVEPNQVLNALLPVEHLIEEEK